MKNSFKILFVVALLVLLLESVDAAKKKTTTQKQQPLEDYFFDSVPLLVVEYYDNTEASSLMLDAMFTSAVQLQVQATQSATSSALLEFRVIQELADSSTPQTTTQLNDKRIGTWQLWRSVLDYNSIGTQYPAFNLKSYAQVRLKSRTYYSKLSQYGGCHYCGATYDGTSKPVLGHFALDQTKGKYPIVSTFGIYLAGQTSQETDTLDYVSFHPLTRKPSSNDIPYEFDRVDFWEMYRSPAAFNTHVVTVNNTLRPEAANWFIDLGATSTVWHSVLRFTSGCYKC